MFCSNCGKQIPDGTKFCNHCGAQQQIIENTGSAPQTTENQQNTPVTSNQQASNPPKKKVNIILTVVIVLCAFLIGKFVIAPSLISDSGNGDETDGNGVQQTTNNNGGSTQDPVNSAYEAIFDGSNIVHFQMFFNMDMKNFAMKQDKGIICCADYGYKDDVVKQWVETMYIPVAEYTDSQKTELENTMKSQFATLDALSCCVVNYKMSANYLTITFTYSDVDKAQNYGELYNAKILQTNTFISMSATESTLLTQGFVKK